ncbi:MAG: N-acetyltransferase family protein [Pseudomonas kermanshahensis]|uniref:GNAT family N-acetyltransferase n=1 Tax=Pseudomonas kermanshahensis TaxID=2745482 RepID=UPI003D14FB01
MSCPIRLANADDAEGISRVVIAALRGSNAADYDAETILRIEASFSAAAILESLTRRLVFVALIEDEVIATASLDGDVVRSVFVEPQHQGLGVGKQMMAVIEDEAIARGLKVLRVPSSIAAEGFYAGLGFCKVRDAFYGEERTVVMQKTLPAFDPSGRSRFV